MTRPPYPGPRPVPPPEHQVMGYAPQPPRKPGVPTHPVRIVFWVVAIILMVVVIINIFAFDAEWARLLSWLHQWEGSTYTPTGR